MTDWRREMQKQERKAMMVVAACMIILTGAFIALVILSAVY